MMVLKDKTQPCHLWYGLHSDMGFVGGGGGFDITGNANPNS